MGATQSSNTERLYKEYIKQQQHTINSQQEYINSIKSNNLIRDDPYLLLGVPYNINNEKILKKEYLKKALKNHPDRGGNKEDFQKLTIAYTIILNKLKEKNSYSSHHDMKKQNKVYSENQPSKMNQKFDIDLFNKIYDENRLSNVYDNGYGDWMKNNEPTQQPKLYTDNFNRDLFNKEFVKYKKESNKSKEIVKYREPDVGISFKSSDSIMTLGQGNIDDYSISGASDYKMAFENNFLIDTDEFGRTQNFKNMNDIENNRSNISYTPSNEELLYIQNKELLEKKEEDNRILRLKEEDNKHFLQHNKISNRLLNR